MSARDEVLDVLAKFYELHAHHPRPVALEIATRQVDAFEAEVAARVTPAIPEDARPRIQRAPPK